MLMFKYDNATFSTYLVLYTNLSLFININLKFFNGFIENMLQFYLYRSIIINTKKY